MGCLSSKSSAVAPGNESADSSARPRSELEPREEQFVSAARGFERERLEKEELQQKDDSGAERTRAEEEVRKQTQLVAATVSPLQSTEQQQAR